MSLPVSLDDDFYAWILQQASALRSRGDLPVDWDKLAEELDGLGRAEENSLQSCLERLLVHLLKYVYQPQKNNSELGELDRKFPHQD
jgi:Domain of unknown function DUF29